MYDTILLTLDGSSTDRAIIDHVKALASIMHSRVVLLHVATGVPAQWNGPNAGGEEIDASQAYLDKVRLEFEAAAVPAKSELAYGDPVKEIVKWVEQQGCDLVAMGTHGHRVIADLVLGATGKPGAAQYQRASPASQITLRARH